MATTSNETLVQQKYHETQFQSEQNEVRRSWQVSSYHKVRLLGPGALMLSTCCILVSLGVLMGSHQKPTHTWTWQPTVYLAVVTAISNASLAFAYSQAFPTAWWYEASQGSTIRRLHRQWEAGTGWLHALAQARPLDILSVACLFTSFVVIDGPLLQRASSVAPFTSSEVYPMNISIAPEIPTGFSGQTFIYNDTKVLRTQSNRKAANDMVVREWAYHLPITVSNLSCPETCYAKVRAPAIKPNCFKNTTTPITVDDFSNGSSTWGTFANAARTPAFYVNMEPYQDPTYEISRLYVGRVIANDSARNGEYVETACTLNAATAEYDITVHADTITYSTSSAAVSSLEIANNTVPHTYTVGKWLPDTTTILLELIRSNVSANATVDIMADHWQILPASIDLATYTYQWRYEALTGRSGESIFGFTDPLEDIIAQINDLFFRVGVLAATFDNTSLLIDPGLTIHQLVNSSLERTENGYFSDLRWWAAAACLELLAILIVLSMYWRCCRLGLPTTMNPFEIGRAFEAPMFVEVSGAGGVESIIDQIGGKKVKLEDCKGEARMVEVGNA